MQELYETEYGIYNHLTSTKPLASVSLHKAEEYFTNSLYDRYLSVFLYREINKKLGISFDDFINRPMAEIERIISIVSDVDKKRNEANEGMLKDLEEDRKNIDKKN